MPESGPVVVLAGGTGGAKLARGLLDVTAPGELVVVANTGDDIEIHGAYVSPDPDLITFWLTDRIDERGWGLAGDTFEVMAGLRALGEEVWFNLGDRDLAIGLRRAADLAAGGRLTEAQRRVGEGVGLRAAVLPMSDQPVRTRVRADHRWWSVQEFLIRRGERGPVQDVEFRGAGGARATPEVLSALASARAIVIGPSNPILSIGPILAVRDIQEALIAARAPVLAVSPIVDRRVLKGPTEAFLRWRRVSPDSAGIATLYAGLLDGVVCDEDAVTDVPRLRTNVLMDSPAARRRLATETLDFAQELARNGAGSGDPQAGREVPAR